MEKGLNIYERIKHLEGVLEAIRLCTQPKDGHSDPGSIIDCWNEVGDALESVKSKIKRDVFYTWLAAIDRCRNEGANNYDSVVQLLGVNNFDYLKEDNI